MAKPKSKLIMLIIIAVFAVFFGLTVNWDQNHYWHPDERMIIMTGMKLKPVLPLAKLFYQPDASPYNPHFFAYGSLPIYIITFLNYLPNLKSSFDLVTLASRWLNFLVLVSLSLTIAQIAWLASRKSQIKILSLFLTFLTFFIWQNTHFYTVDLALTLWFALIVLIMAKNQTKRLSIKTLLALAVITAAGMATKFTFILILPFISLFLFLQPKTTLDVKTHQMLLWLVLSLVFLFFLQPYMFIDHLAYFTQLKNQLRMSKSPFSFPYTLQYVGTQAYAYPLQQMFLWGFGPFIGLASIIGLIRMGLNKVVPKASFAWLILFSLVYFLILGRSAVKFMRYFLPIYPIFVILAAMGIYVLMKSKRRFINLVGASLFILIVLWWQAFAFVHLQTPTRLAAGRWLDKQADIQKVGVEHWDDRLPLNRRFDFVEFPHYDPETPPELKAIKQEKIDQGLNQIQAYIIASPRLYKPILNLRSRYPVSSRFYNNLFSYQTKLKTAHVFSVKPRFLFWSLNDSSADESFYVYDHPPVVIFTN